MSWDAGYVAYARYIERRGLFAFIGRRFPLLRFKPGCLFNFGGQPGERGQAHPTVPGLATE